MGRGAWKRGEFGKSADNWAAGYTASGPAIAKGIQQPKRSPTQAAIAAKDRMVAGINEAVASGRWQNALAAAGDAGWQEGMTKKTIPSLATRATAGKAHFSAFAAGYGGAVVAQAQSLPPRGDFNANMARSQAMAQWQHQNKGKYRKMWRGGAGA